MNRRSASVGLSCGLLLLLGGSAYAGTPTSSSSNHVARDSSADASVVFTLPGGWVLNSTYTTLQGQPITFPTGVTSSSGQPTLSAFVIPSHKATASANFLITANPPTMGAQLQNTVSFSVSTDAQITDINHNDSASATASCANAVNGTGHSSSAVPNINAADPTTMGENNSAYVQFVNNSGAWTAQGTVSVSAVCNP